MSQLKNNFFLVTITLVFFLGTNAHAQTSCLKSSSAQQRTCTNSPVENTTSDEPSFIAYRLAVKGSSERKCRFEPTCSQFLIESIKRHGLAKGMRNAFARSQMQHDDQFGTLPTALRDNFIVVLDPVTNWDDK